MKYPRTYHVPFSEGCTSDDKKLTKKEYQNNFILNNNIYMSEKLDGENTTITKDKVYARSLDSIDHKSRHWVKRLASEFQYDLGDLRIHGENLYAKHSIYYDKLPSYFMVFGVSKGEYFLSLRETIDVCVKYNLKLNVFKPYDCNMIDEDLIKYQLKSYYSNECEGFVLRNGNKFHINDFKYNVAKYVRKNHVKTDSHWIHNEIIKNKLHSGLF